MTMTTAEGASGEAVALIDLDSAGSTPILREYRRIKEEYPDAIVLARLGDFFEMFGVDAQAAAPILGVTLTARGFGNAGKLPMCGVPHHSITGHIGRLLKAGHSVVLWDQVGDVQSGKLVERAVTRVLSPGTVIEAEYLASDTAARLAALVVTPTHIGLAVFDAAGGEMHVAAFEGDLTSTALRDECERLDIAEVLIADGVELPENLLARAVVRRLAPSLFDRQRAAERLQHISGATALQWTGLERDAVQLGAVGAILAHCDRAKIAIAPYMLRIRHLSSSTQMRVDPQTRRNLELVAASGSGKESLLDALNATATPMGARLLRQRLQEPLTEPLLINARLDSVTWLRDQARIREVLRAQMAKVSDLERLVSRCVQAIASPRDLGAIRDCLALIPDVASTVAAAPGVELKEAGVALLPQPALHDYLRGLLVDEPPPHLREGGAVRAGADEHLDALMSSSGSAREFIAGLETRERERTGIKALKVGYNRVFGYYIEVSNAARDAVPPDYIRKQTLSGAERFITPELKEQEVIVLSARDKALLREQELVREAVECIAAVAEPLLAAARAVAIIDVSQSLAEVASSSGWVRPEVDASVVIDIEKGRHPLVERSLPPHQFVANDTTLDASERIVILTGPNMAGKSTFLRQVALITLLAHIGSYVPAGRARIGACDRIFTRIGAHDDLAGGMSTFMVEMAETAAILRQASSRSLVILDEIGRGTSTYDGLSIAQAVVEHIHDAPQLNCRTLFATHYHELTALAGRLSRVRNARVEVVEEGDTVTFLHRIVGGGADRSYGLHVAKLAGIPLSVVSRARTLLAEMEEERPLTTAEVAPDQLALGIGEQSHPVVDEIGQLDLNQLTPLEALNKIAQWQQKVD